MACPGTIPNSVIRAKFHGLRTVSGSLSSTAVDKLQVHASTKSYNKQHNKFIFLTAISVLVMSNLKSFRVLFDKIASEYFI